MKQSIRQSVSAVALIGVLGGTAWAQDGDASDLDRIVVTAQKREQAITDVPIAVSVLDAETIDSSFSYNIEGLQTLVPSVSFRKGSTNANSAITVRGIGTISFSLAAEPSVSTVVDGVALGRSGQAFADLYDIERLEVLKGPQGTLFGKNASAGVLNIVTKRPSQEFEGNVSATYFEDNEWRVRGRIAGPLTDELSASLTAYQSAFDGHIRNVFNNEDVNGYDRFGFRGMLNFEPSDDFSVLAIYEHNEADDDCCADLEVLSSGRNPASPAAPNAPSAGDVADGVADDELDLDQRLVDHDFTTQTIDNTDAFSLEINKGVFGDHDLISISSYREWENTELREGDFTSIGGTFNEPVFGVPFLLHDNGTRTWRQFSEELRIQSPGDQAFQYLFGAYYQNLDAEADFTRNASCQNNGGQVQPILDANPGLTCNSNDIVSATGFFNNTFENWALFANGDYDVMPGLNVFAGFRYTNDDVSFVYTRRNNDPFGRQGVGVRPAEPNSQFPEATGGFDNTFTGQTDNTDFSVKAGLNADLGEFIGGGANLGSAYFSYSQGYKGPGFNTFYNMGVNDTLPIDPEESDWYEVGYKYGTGNMFLSFAAYTATIDGFQANNFDNSTGVTITRLTNAGSVKTQGVELDLTVSPTENLTLTGGIAYNKAEIDEFNCPIDPTTGQPPANCSARSGIDLLFSPDLNYTFSGEYSMPLGVNSEAFVRGAYAHIDDQESLLPGNDGSISTNSRLPGYDLVDLVIGLRYMDRYRVELIGKNLLDESFVTTFSGDGFRYQIPRDADRRFGVNFSADF